MVSVWNFPPKFHVLENWFSTSPIILDGSRHFSRLDIVGENESLSVWALMYPWILLGSWSDLAYHELNSRLHHKFLSPQGSTQAHRTKKSLFESFETMRPKKLCPLICSLRNIGHCYAKQLMQAVWRRAARRLRPAGMWHSHSGDSDQQRSYGVGEN